MPYASKEDQAKAAARHYAANKDQMVARAMAHKAKLHRELRELIRQLKGTTPCLDCGVQYPYYVMQFDHLPEHEKSFQIGDTSKWTSRKRVLAEIAKCEIVCANCHAERTYARMVETTRGGEASISLGS